MASDDYPGKPISETLKIAFEALKKHERHMDKITTKLGQNGDNLKAGTKKLSNNLEEILQELSSLEQKIEKLRSILQT